MNHILGHHGKIREIPITLLGAWTLTQLGNLEEQFKIQDQRLEERFKSQDNRIWGLIEGIVLALFGLLAKMTFFPPASL